MACEMIWEPHGILFKHSGRVDMDEVTRMNDRMYGDPRFDQIRYQIADYTEVTSNLITRKDASVVGTLDRTSAVWNIKMLNIVVTQDETFLPVVDAYFNMFQGTEWRCRVFKTLDEAYQWISQEIPDEKL